VGPTCLGYWVKVGAVALQGSDACTYTKRRQPMQNSHQQPPIKSNVEQLLSGKSQL